MKTASAFASPGRISGSGSEQKSFQNQGIEKADAEHENSICVRKPRKDFWERERAEVLPEPGG